MTMDHISRPDASLGSSQPSPFLIQQDAYQPRVNVRDVVIQVVYNAIMLVNGLLFLRFIFTAVGIEKTDGLVGFIYSSTHSLVQPFFDLFNSRITYGTGEIEFETLMAIVVYSLIARAVIRLVEQSAESRDYS